MPEVPATTASNLPTLPFNLGEMANALRNAAREGATPASALLLMDRSGNWRLGLDAEPVDSDQEFVVNPAGFQKGFICWKSEGTEKLGEIVVPVNATIPELGPVPPGGRGWEYQMGMQVRAIGGDLDGREAVYRSSSLGGRRALVTFMQATAARIVAYQDDPKQDAFVPVICLSSDSYPNKRYGGKTFNPVIDIKKWIRMPGPDAVKPAAKDAREEPSTKSSKNTKSSKRR